MFCFRRKIDEHTIFTLKRLYSFNRKNHYDVLNLKRNCTPKDIKDAFIRKSKEYHPDKNKSAAAQEKFVEVLDAYNVLSKPSKRAEYDSMYRNSRSGGSNYKSYTYPYTYQHQANYYYGYGFDQQAYSQFRKRPHYTDFTTSTPNFDSKPKVPNYIIFVLCIGFAVSGFVLQVLVVRHTVRVNQERANQRSKQLGEELERLRATALKNGNELQTQILLDKISAGASTTAATAALGHALANTDKKRKSEIAERGVSENSKTVLDIHDNDQR